MAFSTRKFGRIISATLLGIIIPVGFSFIFLDLGIYSYLAPIPSGLALGLLVFTNQSLEKDAIRAMLVGLFAGSLSIIIYVFVIHHDVSFPQLELVGIAIIFSIGPLINMGFEWFRRKKGSA